MATLLEQVEATAELRPAIAGRNPWALAARRLHRNRLALAALGLFLLIVVLGLLTPWYAHDIARQGNPLAPNLNGTTVIGGKVVPVMEQGGGTLHLGETPIGPTGDLRHYFLGADNLGRDVACLLLYGARSSLQIGISSAVICCAVATVVALIAGFFGGWADAVLSRIMDIIWAFPVYLLAISISTELLTHSSGIQVGPVHVDAASLWLPTAIVAPGETLGIVGESGSGKSVTMMSVMRLSNDPNARFDGEVIYKGPDEPTTALDVTIQAQILKLIKTLRDESGTAVVLITHDMGVVADIADRVAVMYAGRVVEQGTLRDLFYDAQHPYTWGLLGSIARLDRPRPRRLTAIQGLPPSLIRLPEGCAFGPRCAQRFDRCSEVPLLASKVDDGHLDACHLDPQQKKERRDRVIRPDLTARQDLAVPQELSPERTEEPR